MKLASNNLVRTSPAAVESLERRLFMDGDVSVTFSNGELCIRGDGDDNQVIISQPSPGTIRVEGREETGVNGEESVDFSGPLDDLKVNMKQGGEDEVAIQGAMQIGGSVAAKMGNGQFIVEGSRGPVEIDRDLDVEMNEISACVCANPGAPFAVYASAVQEEVVCLGDSTSLLLLGLRL